MARAKRYHRSTVVVVIIVTARLGVLVNISTDVYSLRALLSAKLPSGSFDRTRRIETCAGNLNASAITER